ncbi:terminase large subunit [Ferrovum sp.]|uniref:terminase large subunit domain-containing protein n=1 Tax=Ferrovum sp. TaxID=2609467 RepID=UPI002636DE35|nr:terminase large subunit [Ferrovum sp.]
MESYASTAHHYAEAVVAGEIAACRWVKLACQRQLDDLARVKGKANPCRFNPKLVDRKGRSFHPADNLCAFIERLPHVKGPLAGEMVKLEPWQVFILTTVFGWVKPDGTRRFRRSYIEVPRGNGKALDAETLIPTPQGFKRMADLQVGDQVFDERGRPCAVTAVSDILHERPCYRVNFSTGESVVADADHEWLTHAKVDRPGTKRI